MAQPREPLKTLSSSELRSLLSLVERLRTFWESPKFAHGIDTPFCSKEEATLFLEEAAEVAVRASFANAIAVAPAAVPPSFVRRGIGGYLQ